MKKVWLIVTPRSKKFLKTVPHVLLSDSEVDKFVFHSYGLKVWMKPRFFPKRPPYLGPAIEVKDRTKHFDDWLLKSAMSILQRCYKKRYKPENSIAILSHYLFNMTGRSYSDEEKFFSNRVKKYKKFMKKKYTNVQDHGWELKELKKRGLIS